MRKRLGYGLLFLALLLLAAISQWPAATLASLLERASNDRWRLTSPSGSIWHGAGMLLARADKNTPWRNIQNITWQIRPAELLRGRLVADISPEQGRLRLSAGISGLQAENVELRLPASAIAPLLPGALSRYRWQGMLRADGERFDCNWAGSDCQGRLEVFWREASLGEIPGIVLGDYHITLTGQGPATQIELQTLRGQLQIDGKGELTAADGLHFSGLASAPSVPIAAMAPLTADPTLDDMPNPLAALLNTLGRPTGDGKYLLEYRQTR